MKIEHAKEVLKEYVEKTIDVRFTSGEEAKRTEVLFALDTVMQALEKKERKPYESRKKVPCLCGRKQLRTWNSNREYMVDCPVCGLSTNIWSSSEGKASAVWNEMIKSRTINTSSNETGRSV